MNFVKWVRKNQRQVMSVFVIVIMIAFVAGSGFQYILNNMLVGAGKAIAHYGQGIKISRNDYNAAREDIELLKSLRADIFLRYYATPQQRPDLRVAMLGQVLFGGASEGADLYGEMRQAAVNGALDAGVEQIEEFFRQTTGNGEVYWILLRSEARRAGCVFTNEQAGERLKKIISEITQGNATAAQLVGSIVNGQHIPEEKILSTFADLLGVLTYVQMVTGNEDVTTPQIQAMIGRGREKVNVEFVKFPAEEFAVLQAEPADQELVEQFEKYRSFTAGIPDDGNPYGFGYRQPAMVQIEYIIAKLDDVKSQIVKPSQEELEDYYRRNISQFQYQELSDPNNPNSEKIVKTRSYAEMSEQIRQVMIRDRTNRRADMIFAEAKDQAETGFAGLDMEKIQPEQMAKASADYSSIAAKTGQKYDLKLYAGKTGLLSESDIAADKYLSRLAVQGRSRMPVQLNKYLLLVEQADAGQPGAFEAGRPRIWENIGPIKDNYGSIIAMVRIIAAQKASEPASLDVGYSKKGVELDNEPAVGEISEYSVRKAVADDCRILKGANAAKTRADELVKLVTEKGWDEGLRELNARYSEKKEGQETTPSATMGKYPLDKLTEQVRSSATDIQRLRTRFSDNPAAMSYMKGLINTSNLMSKACGFLPEGQTEITDIKTIVDVPSEPAVYVVKGVSIMHATKQDYQSYRGIAAYQIGAVRGESLALVHLTPDNIRKRMNFKWVESETKTQNSADDTEEPAKANETKK